MGGKLLSTHRGLQKLLLLAGFCTCVLWYFMMAEGPLQREGYHCVDLAPDCTERVQQGLCLTDRGLMQKQCTASCGMCGHNHVLCVDTKPRCASWASAGECKSNPVYMLKNCQRSCGVCVTCIRIESPALDKVTHVSISNDQHNGRPVYRSSSGLALNKEDDGLWALEDRHGDVLVRQSVATDTPYEAGASWLVREGENWVPSETSVVEGSGCLQAEKQKADGIKLPDQVRNARQGLRPPVKGVDYEADYDVLNPKPAPPSYEYPSDGSAAFMYPEDVKGAPDIPYYIVSHVPKVYYFPRFLSDEEADSIVAEAKKHVVRSDVVPIKGKSAHGYDNVRTSYGCWLDNRHSHVEDVRRRILAVTGFNTTQAEKLQVLRYEVGGKYISHLDYYQPHGARTKEEAEELWRLKWGKRWNRAATFYMFLEDTEEGGETLIPRANGGPHPPSMHDCSKGLRVHPKKGAAVLFYSMKPNKEQDEYSLHAGCPVKSGVKWGAPQWLHVNVRDTGDDESMW